MIQKSLANYAAEALALETIASDTGPNILLIQGGSGSGKSHLIAHCLNAMPDIASALLKLNGGGASIPALFTNAGMQCGWGQLPSFSSTVARLLEQPAKTGDPLWQMSMHRHLREIGKINDLESRLFRYRLLTDAWFADLRQFDTPFLLAVDAYEHASLVFDRWFGQEFLYGVANSDSMRVLLICFPISTP